MAAADEFGKHAEDRWPIGLIASRREKGVEKSCKSQQYEIPAVAPAIQYPRV
jgi:hypothetical protein